MRFAQKIFLAVFCSVLFIAAAIWWTTYHFTSRQVEDDFVKRYLSFSKVVGETLTQLDKRTESLMYTAAKYVADKDQGIEPLSTDYLKKVRDDLNITHLFIVDKGGNFVRSTNEDPKLIPNAFSFCPKYKNLVLGSLNIEATPILHPEPEPKPFKFLFVPTENRERLIEVGVRVDFITQTLSEALSSDSNVLSLALYSPHGKSLGKFQADQTSFEEEKIDLPKVFPAWQDHGEYYDFFTKVTSSHPQCCQCDVSGTSLNGEYYYVL
ncbi:MAG: hypothetical protein KDD22_03570, partial [Bdellovibrionales bacterium]|nr:hypothetical protein [Bdellovibrionales bacterium]